MTDFTVVPIDPVKHAYVHAPHQFVGQFTPVKSFPVYFAGISETEVRESARKFLREELARAGHPTSLIAERCRDELPTVRTRQRVQPVAQEQL
jgi:hypothetical protein